MNDVGPRRVAVTALADFACRTGDLDGGGLIGPSALQGQRAHRALQARLSGEIDGLECERRIERVLEVDGERWCLGGRVDLLERARGAVGEIKSTFVPAARLPTGRRALHRAQAMLYAGCLAAEQDLGQVEIAVHYVNLLNDRVEVFRETLERETLERHTRDALERHARWQRALETRRAALRRRLATLDFPFAGFREGQRTLATAVYRTNRDGAQLLCEAPTGIGKTASTLFPLLRQLGESRLDSIVWATAKRSGALPVLATLQRFGAESPALNVVVLRARDRSCPCARGELERDAEGRCPLTIGFHDRLPDARAALLDAGLFDGGAQDRLAAVHGLCPFALAIEALATADIVVCDYNHVLDPLSRLAFFDDGGPSRALVFDEAHNLVDRSRAMHSGSLDRRLVRAALREGGTLQRAWRRVDRALLRLEPADARDALKALPRGLLRACSAAVEQCIGEMAERGPAERGSPDGVARDLLRDLLRLLANAEGDRGRWRGLVTVSKGSDHRSVQLDWHCLDAAPELARQYRRFRSVTMLSATLSPGRYYREMLGLDPDCRRLKVGSPFPRSGALQLTVDYVPVRWAERERSLPQLVTLLDDVTRCRPGNYIAFLPSYGYLERVWAAFRRACADMPVWRQCPGDDDETRERRLATLAGSPRSLGFAITGGLYGEGVDYTGETLIGAVIVTVGWPPPDERQRLLSDHYRERGFDGFAVAAVWPGLTRVLQSAGRVIRGADERGVILLVDDRFDSPRYRRLLPEHWCALRAASPQETARLLGRFWDDAHGEAIRDRTSAS